MVHVTCSCVGIWSSRLDALRAALPAMVARQISSQLSAVLMTISTKIGWLTTTVWAGSPDRNIYVLPTILNTLGLCQCSVVENVTLDLFAWPVRRLLLIFFNVFCGFLCEERAVLINLNSCRSVVGGTICFGFAFSFVEDGLIYIRFKLYPCSMNCN